MDVSVLLQRYRTMTRALEEIGRILELGERVTVEEIVDEVRRRHEPRQLGLFEEPQEAQHGMVHYEG